jgi:hypothetical protein
MTCMYCNFGVCAECSEPREDETSIEASTGAVLVRCCCDGMGYRPGSLSLAETFIANRDDDAEIDELPSREKAGSEMKDVLSTGRKRAAKAAPIHDGMVCEWAGLLNAGGGVVPIIGCIGNPASDRHHGPDKNVLNNVVKVNLHRICDNDHARWHQLNDPYYGERPADGEPFVPINGAGRMHDAFAKADTGDQLANELWWQTPVGERPEYRNWSLTNVERSDSLFIEANGEAEDE